MVDDIARAVRAVSGIFRRRCPHSISVAIVPSNRFDDALLYEVLIGPVDVDNVEGVCLMGLSESQGAISARHIIVFDRVKCEPGACGCKCLLLRAIGGRPTASFNCGRARVTLVQHVTDDLGNCKAFYSKALWVLTRFTLP